MFRDMRRKGQRLSQEEVVTILQKEHTAVLAVIGDHGYPYTIPINFAFEDGHIYFHCAVAGHKLDAIEKCSKVSLCVVSQDTVISEQFTTHYRSVVVFGQAKVVRDEGLKRHALECLIKKYAPNHGEAGQKEINDAWARTAVVDMTIEHLTGKGDKSIQ